VMAGQGLNMTFMSQEDEMNFSVQTCREKLPEAWDLADGIVDWVQVLQQSIVPKRKRAAKKSPARKKVVATKKAATRKATPKKKATAKRKVTSRPKAAR
jgi:hypothetical protein